jgi:ArsR family transcriptional regulator
MKIDRPTAEAYASWFGCLADPTRLLVLNLLAHSDELKVREIVDSLDVGQPTVSHHLRRLHDTGFARVRRAGNERWWRVNERCIQRFPSAAEIVMGRLPAQPRPAPSPPAWVTDRRRTGA